MGITFEMLKALCEQTKVHLIILGRSPIHDLAPSFLMPGVTPATIMAQVKARMTGAKPLEIKKEVDRIIRTRDALMNLRSLESLALSVRYESVDVTDDKALAQVLKKHKSIDGIIHAAGIEESQFIDKKDLASFTRVTGVKILGLHNLIRAMAGRAYRYLITFSSVTARFGNDGQSDYTAANDMIGKMVMKEKLAHPDRRYKIYAWTAWSGAGMAENETVKTVLTSRGVTFLPLADGIRFFLSDLENATDTEVVISGLDLTMDVDGLLKASAGTALSAATPFLDRETVRENNRVTFHRTLSLTRDLFLLDHSMEGTPIFLGATGIETMAEAASVLHGPGALAQVRDFAIPYGIKILKGRPKDIIVSAEKQGDADYACAISSVFKNPKGQVMGDPTLHYQGRFTFDRAFPPAPRITWPTLSPVSFEGPAEALIYNPRRLFMEDLFKTLKDVVSFDGEVLITSFCETSDKPFFSDLARPAFLTDLTAVDALFQTGGLLEFFTTSTLVLPYKIGTLTIFGRTVRGETYRCLTRKTEDGPETNTYQLDLAHPDGTVLIRIEDFQMVKLGTLDNADRIADLIRTLEPEGV
jgi:NAD(P)-dependent dehydrogenase (short-subunit alcohol dehydrogenase family)